jgi:hypothetical protein
LPDDDLQEVDLPDPTEIDGFYPIERIPSAPVEEALPIENCDINQETTNMHDTLYSNDRVYPAYSSGIAEELTEETIESNRRLIVLIEDCKNVQSNLNTHNYTFRTRKRKYQN